LTQTYFRYCGQSRPYKTIKYDDNDDVNDNDN